MLQRFVGEALVPLVQSLPSHVHLWMLGVAERLLVLLSFILNASVCLLYVKTWRWSPTTKQKRIDDEDRLKVIDQYLRKHSLTLTQADFCKENNENNHHAEEPRVQIRIPKCVPLVSSDENTGTVCDNDNNNSTTTPSSTTTTTEEQMHLESRSISDECAICMNQYTIGDKIAWSTNPHCIHCYHVDCLRFWLVPWEARNQCCPCCRQAYCKDELSQHDYDR